MGTDADDKETFSQLGIVLVEESAGKGPIEKETRMHRSRGMLEIMDQG